MTEQSTEREVEAGQHAPGLTLKDIEMLGRQRPAVFKTAWAEYGFCFSLLASAFMAVRIFSLSLSLWQSSDGRAMCKACIGRDLG